MPDFLPALTGCFAQPVAENPTVVMMEAAFAHHGLHCRYINMEVAPGNLADAVRGAQAQGYIGFNCSLPHKVAVIAHLDGVAESARIIGAVNCAVRRGEKWIGENTDGRGFLESLTPIASPARTRSCRPASISASSHPERSATRSCWNGGRPSARC